LIDLIARAVKENCRRAADETRFRIMTELTKQFDDRFPDGFHVEPFEIHVNTGGVGTITIPRWNPNRQA